MGYSTLGNAKHSLKQSFNENEDYLVFTNNRKNSDDFTDVSAKVGRPDETVKMTFDCFFKFARKQGIFRVTRNSLAPDGTG